MKSYLFCSAVLLGMLALNNSVCAEEQGVGLLGIKPHRSTEREPVCMTVKADEAVTADCNEPKCYSGGAAVDAALASKNLKRVCKMKDASVNRGFDVTYIVNGQKLTTWTARDPELELKRAGLTVLEEHTPLNPACAKMTFKEASTNNECSQMNQ